MYSKNLYFLMLLLLLFLLGGCSEIKSSDKVTQEITIDKVRNISLSGYGDLILKQSDKEQKLSIETEKDILPYIKARVDGDRLIIKVETKKIRNPQPQITFHVNVKTLNSLMTEGYVMVQDSDIKVDALKLEHRGSGSVKLNLDVANLEIKSQGSISFNLHGAAKNQEIALAGAIKYNALSLQSSTCTLSGSGAVVVMLNCSELIQGELTGASNLIYKESPKMEVSTSIASNVKKY
ncbi:hypothetical protein BH09DEP1_BH09DEP1_6770 [soil metagenome]